MLAELSEKLTDLYGKGFSETTLQYWRKFYLAYPDRGTQIPRPSGMESSMDRECAVKSRPLGVESLSKSYPAGSLSDANAILSPLGRESEKAHPVGTQSGDSQKPYPMDTESA